MRRVFILLCCLSLATLAGCQTMKDTWNWTLEHVDPDPEIELNTAEIGDDNEERLALLFAPVDEKLEELNRLMEVQGDYPDEKWFTLLFDRFPWVDGVMTTDAKGNIMTRKPEVSMKSIDITPLMQLGEEWLDRKPKAVLHETELGPEISISSPFIKERDWLGLVVVHFDPRNLISLCPHPEELIVFTPKVLIWPGKDEDAAKALFGLDWAEILETGVDGETEAGGRTFTWIDRDFAGIDLIYAVVNVEEQ